MAIPAYKIVKISPRVIQAGGADLVLNGLFLTSNEKLAAGEAKSFSTADAVMEFFGANSDEHKAAVAYFAGYDNSFRKPEKIFFGGRKPNNTGAVLQGAAFSGTLDALKAFKGANLGSLSLTINGTEVTAEDIDLHECASLEAVASAIQTALDEIVDGTTCVYLSGAFVITAPGSEPAITVCSESDLATAMKLTEAAGASAAAGVLTGASVAEAELADLQAFAPANLGTLSLTVNDTNVSVTDLDLHACVSLSGVAEAIQTALDAIVSGTTCAYSSATSAFSIGAPGTGPESTITVCGDSDLATLMCLTEATGASAEQGAVVPSPHETFAAIKGVSENWATFTTVYEASKDEALALAQWASAQGVEYLYVCWTTDDSIKETDKGNDTTSVAHAFLENNVGATGLIYGDLRYAAFLMSIPASIDWDREQGVVTAAFKSQEGLAPVVDSATEADNLIEKRVNFYGTYATRNDGFVWLYPGKMYGQYNFLDPFWNLIWFASAIQTACMMGFKQTPRVPYNEDGYTLIRSWIQDPINRARKCGVIDRGMTLSEPQRALFLRESGMNDQALACLINDGFFLIVRDGSTNDRVNRESPEIGLWITYAGSVQKIEMPVTLFA